MSEATLEQLETIRANDGVQTFIREESGLQFSYTGIGDVYIKAPLNTELSLLTVPKKTEPFGDDPDATGEHPYEPEPVVAQVFVDKYLMGGVRADGTTLWRGFEDTEGKLLQDLDERIADWQAIESSGLHPIFWPSKPEFDPTASHQTERYAQLQNAVHEKLTKYFESQNTAVNKNMTEQSQYLEATGMLPRFELDIEGKTFYVSNPFYKSRDGFWKDLDRPFVALYSDHSPEPILYYQSYSHGTWRALLATDSADPSQIWYAKSMFGGENSADAPIVLQKAFNTNLIVNQRKTPLIRQETLFALTKPEHQVKTKNKGESIARALEYADARMRAHGIQSEWGADRTFDQMKLDEIFSEQYKPDFANPVESFPMVTRAYGEVTATVYCSKNGEVRYLVYSVGHKGETQHWLATAEIANSKITDLGLRQRWPQLSYYALVPPIDHKTGNTEKGYEERRVEHSQFDQLVLRSLAAQAGQSHTKNTN